MGTHHGGRSMADLPAKVAHVESMPKTSQENIAAAQQLKDEGNARFKAGDPKNAKLCYAKMNLYLRHLDQNSASGGGEMQGMQQMLGGGGGGKSPAESLSEEEKAQVASLVNAMNSNLSNCFLKIDKPEKAMEKATLVLERDPANEKLRFRRAKAYYLMRDTDHAREDLMQCDPKDKQVVGLLANIEKLEAKAAAKQKKQFA